MSEDLKTLKDSVIQKLSGSFANLERAITGAKERLCDNPNVAAGVVERIAQYEVVLAKQKSIADSLAESFAKEDFNEISRQINLINGLSSMIIEDAKQIIVSLQHATQLEALEAENDDLEYKDKLC